LRYYAFYKSVSSSASAAAADRADVRVIAATNRDLESAIAEKTFDLICITG